MIVRPVRDRVLLHLAWPDAVEVEAAASAVIEATDDYHAHEPVLGSRDLQRYEDQMADAIVDLDELFTERLTIDQAERLHVELHGAIVAAKVAAGRFQQ